MNKEFKKTFFLCLLSVLLIISNLIGQKYTNFLDITIGVDFITFPFTFLCTLLIMNYGSKKDAYSGILIACIIQSLITISYVLATSLGTQSFMPDAATYVNNVFKVKEINILASILAFVTSHSLLIYVYDNFKRYNKELYGLAIGLLGALILNTIIFLGITLHMYDLIYVVNMVISNIIIDIVLIVIIILLFYILKDKKEKIISFTKNEKLNSDLSTEEILENKKEIKRVNKKSQAKTQKKNNQYSKNSKTKTNSNKQVKKSKERK